MIYIGQKGGELVMW